MGTACSCPEGEGTAVPKAGCCQGSEQLYSSLSDFKQEKSVKEAPEYPMWLLPVDRFLEMEGAPKGHQQLRKEGALVQWKQGMFVIFISHQWVAWTHPDPDGLQLSEFRAALRSMIAGELRVGPWLVAELLMGISRGMDAETASKLGSAFIWYDYWSVPQPSLALPGEEAETRRLMICSVNTIPSYVVRSDIFVAMCPEVMHRDTGRVCTYHTWSGRGWCRLELASRGLSSTSHRDSAFFLLYSASNVVVRSSFDWLMAPVGDGEFTVDADRELLAPVVAGLVDKYLSRATRPGDRHGLAKYRFMLANRGRLLRGLSAPRPEAALEGLEQASEECGHMDQEEARDEEAQDEEKEVIEFLERFRFRSLLDVGEAGMGPMHCAAIDGTTSVLKAAVAAGVPVDIGMTDDIVEICESRGVTPLTLAVNWGGPEAVRCLIQFRADPHLPNAFLLTPLHTAAVIAATTGKPEHAETLRLLLESRGDVELPVPNLGGNVLLASASGRHPQALQVLLEFKADIHSSNMLGSFLHQLAIIQGGSRETVALIVKSRADVNARACPEGMGSWAFGAAARLALSLGHNTQFTKIFSELRGSTPLVLAALLGRTDLCEILLETRGDPDLRNDLGHSALDLAVAGGHRHTVKLLELAANSI